MSQEWSLRVYSSPPLPVLSLVFLCMDENVIIKSLCPCLSHHFYNFSCLDGLCSS